MFMKFDKKIRFSAGVIMIIGSFFGGLIGYDLKNIGQGYNHIWVLSLIALYAGLELISKSLNDRK